MTRLSGSKDRPRLSHGFAFASSPPATGGKFTPEGAALET
jgi:hypothetical protein